MMFIVYFRVGDQHGDVIIAVQHVLQSDDSVLLTLHRNYVCTPGEAGKKEIIKYGA